MTRSVEVVSSVHPPDDPRIATKSIRTLVDAGWAVTYTCQAPGPHAREGVDVVVLSGPRLFRSLRASLRVLRARHDVTVVHDPGLVPAAILSGAIHRGKAVVFDLHENLPGHLASRTATPGWLRAPSAWLARMMLRLAERFVTITLAEEGYRALFSGNHEVFPNLPIHQDLPSIGDGAHGFVYVGDVSRARGAVLLAAAVSRLADRHRLTFVGRCPSGLEAEIRTTAGNGVDVHVLGFLPYEEAWRIAAHHAVGVSPLLDLPNYRHSLPTKILEYRAVGLVPVVSDLPASLEATRGSHAAISFRAGDLEDLVRALEASLDDDRGAAAKAEAQDVRSSAAWPAHRFADFYEGLVT